jgi:chaperonin GroES
LAIHKETGGNTPPLQQQDSTGNQKPEGVRRRMNIKPLRDRVLVQPIEEQEVKKGGIIIPDTAKEKPQEGKVIALGTGKRDDDGKLIPFTVKKGDRVLISKYGGTEIKIDGKEYQIMPEEDILAVIE